MVTLRAIVEELQLIQVVEVLTDAELDVAKQHAEDRRKADAGAHEYYVVRDEPTTIHVGDTFPLAH
jgi:hypothetical protein